MRIFLTILMLCVATPALAQTTVSSMKGFEFKTPKGWNHVDQGGRYLMGSETDAGMIIVSFVDGATKSSLTQAASEGFVEQGVMLSPVSKPESIKTKGGNGVSVKLKGDDGYGTTIAARATGIIGQKGAVVVLAVTTPEQIAKLEKRVSTVVNSVRFVKAKSSKGAGALRGTLCNSSGTTEVSAHVEFGSSRFRSVTFDGRGNATYGSQFSASHGGSAGSNSGVVESSARGKYTVKGDRVTVSFPDITANCKVIERQSNGLITGLKCGEDLWGASLCE
jgi:hypothetical protein